jgi:hypothetical protein
MAEAAVVVAVAVVVTAPSAVSVLSATLKALRHVANAQSVPHAANAMWNNAAKVLAKVAAHAKTATAVAVVNLAMPKPKPPLTPTPHPKPKPKHAQKRATNAWLAKSVVKVKAVANAAHVAKAAVNAPHVWTTTAHQKLCHWTTQQPWKAKPHKPTRTVASVVNAAHATVTVVTAVSVATAHRVKKVLQNTPTTAKLLNTITPHTSKPHATQTKHRHPMSHAKRVNHANLVASVKSVPHVMHRVKTRSQLRLLQRPHVKACHAFKASPCLWQRCKL